MKKYKDSQFHRVNPNYQKGLSEEEVNLYKKNGLVNKKNKRVGKSHLRIIFESFFTFFNIILYVLVIIFALFQNLYPSGNKVISITKYGFLIVIFLNALTSIISSEVSKSVIKKMKIVSINKISVIRDGLEKVIDIDDIVLDDILLLKNGNELPCDCKIIQGDCFVNESMITGESNALKKIEGDILLSGSFISYGRCYAQAIKIGNDTYVSNLEDKINNIKKKKSLLISNINRIIKYLVMFLIPIVILVGLKIYYVGEDGKHFVFTLDIITKCGATIVGMIPIGMILLSSISLSESIVNLYKKKVMIQELYAVENLSRVDTLCLDKTGTLTTQNFVVKNYINFTNLDLKNIMPIILKFNNEENKTYLALLDYFGSKTNINEIKNIVHFDSSKKYSITTLLNNDSYYLGAPDILFKNNEKILLKVDNYAKEGYRVLGVKLNDLPIGIIVLQDELRKGIINTINYFYNLDIDIKIISGDNLETVKQIAKVCGIKNYNKAISLENVQLNKIKDLSNEYTIFTRATPEQKYEIVHSLINDKKVVGYIGDGVNDTLSLKEANCSISLNSGAQSSKCVSDVILLDDDFSNLPLTFLEGRRVVSNIERSLLLFLTKSIFIGLFSFLSIFNKNGLIIEIESIYIYEFVSIALCGFLLSLQNHNLKPLKGEFIKVVLLKSLKYGIFMTISSFLVIILNYFLKFQELSSLVTINITLAGLMILFEICRPFNKYTKFVFIIGVSLSILLMFGFSDVFLNPNYLKTANSSLEQIQLIFDDFFKMNVFKAYTYKEVSFIVSSIIFIPFLYYLIDWMIKFINRHIKNKKS